MSSTTAQLGRLGDSFLDFLTENRCHRQHARRPTRRAFRLQPDDRRAELLSELGMPFACSAGPTRAERRSFFASARPDVVLTGSDKIIAASRQVASCGHAKFSMPPRA